MYTLYLDKSEEFLCEIQIKNATTKNSIARIILESDESNLIFNGKIENGKCIIPIKRLKGILSENVVGNISLEIILEDTYFKPWSDKFSVKEHTSVKVKVNENKINSNKPIIEVRVPVIKKSTIKKTKTEFKKQNISVPIFEISLICEKFGVKKSNLIEKKKDFYQILKTYFKYNIEYKNNLTEIVSRVGIFLK